ncbi:hypothetical protein Tco_0648689 [Tanacetum coccineum]
MADERPIAEQLQAPPRGFESANRLLKNLSPELGSFSRGTSNESSPHHDFAHVHQLDTFYNSLSYNDQDSLNSAVDGNFLYKSPNEGLQIIENKAKVRCSRNAVMRVSTNAPPSSSTNEMNEMKNMMKSLCLLPFRLKRLRKGVLLVVVLASQLDTFKKTTEGSMPGYRKPYYHMKAEISDIEVQATYKTKSTLSKSEFKNE